MSGAFTPEELVTLEKTQAMRMRLATNIMEKPDDQLPKKPAELMATTNLLESIDRSILGRAKVRVDDDSAKNASENKELLRSLMMELHQNRAAAQQAVPIEANQTTQAPAYAPSGATTVTPGELILRTDVPELPDHLR